MAGAQPEPAEPGSGGGSIIGEHCRLRQWDKLLAYTGIRTIREYLMISGERCAVQHYSGQTGDEEWNVRVYENLTDAVILESRGCRLTLAEIYATVEPHSTGQELYPAE